MAGQQRRVIGITRFNAATSATATEYRVKQHIPVAEWTEVTIMARMHDVTWGGTGAQAKIMAYADGFTQEDPAKDFLEATALTGNVEFKEGTDEAPAYYAASLSGDLGGMITVVVEMTGSAQGATVIDLSIDLALKS